MCNVNDAIPIPPNQATQQKVSNSTVYNTLYIGVGITNNAIPITPSPKPHNRKINQCTSMITYEVHLVQPPNLKTTR